MSNLYKTPTADLLARMAYHVEDTPGRILRGWRLDTDLQKERLGLEDLPCLRILPPAVAEVARPRMVLLPELTFRIHAIERRDLGLVHFMGSLEKVLDALETNTAGELQPVLAGCRAPFRMAVGQAIPLDISLAAVITLTTEPNITTRGRRR